MVKNDGFQKSVGKTLFLLAILVACLVAVHSVEGCEAAEAPSPVGLQPSPDLVADVVSSCPDGLQFVNDGVVYGAFGDGVAEVLGFEGYPSTDLVVPREVASPDGREYKVVRIADDAFRDMAVLESVVIPDTVTEIGRNAFGGCESLTALTVPVTVGCHLGDDGYAFKDVLLEELTLTKGVDGIQNEGNEFWKPMTGMLRHLVTEEGVASFTTPFKDSSHLKSVVLKDVESIGQDQFRNCKNLLKVVAPKVKTVEDNAFMDCSRLNTVDLSSLESFTRGILVHCSSLGTVISDSLFINDGQLFMILDDDSVSLIQQLDNDPVFVDVPSEVASPSGRNYAVTEIGKEAFRGHRNLVAIAIFDNVKKIDEHAFHDCKSLKHITIPIGIDCSYNTNKAAFKGVKPKELVLTSGGYDPEGYMDNEFWKPFKGSLEGLFLEEDITDFKTSFKGTKLTRILMDGVKTVHKDQFRDCEKLVIASFTEATTIEKSAFTDCDSLIFIDASNVKNIGNQAFHGCFVLGEFIGDSVETVGAEGFSGCFPLSEFNFDSIKKVGPRAFHDTAVTNVPSSKSQCFTGDAFGSSGKNVGKSAIKKFKLGVSTALASFSVIATGVSIYGLISTTKKLLQTQNEYEATASMIYSSDANLMNGDACFSAKVIHYSYRDSKNLRKVQVEWSVVLVISVLAAAALSCWAAHEWQTDT